MILETSREIRPHETRYYTGLVLVALLARLRLRLCLRPCPLAVYVHGAIVLVVTPMCTARGTELVGRQGQTYASIDRGPTLAQGTTTREGSDDGDSDGV